MASTATYQCQRCNGSFVARTTDRKRGWARFCSKSCKAIRQDQNGGTLGRKTKDKAAHARYAANRQAQMTGVDKLRASATGAARRQGVDLRTWLEHRLTYGGSPQFNRRGEYEGTTGRFSEELEYDDFEPLYEELDIERIDDGEI